MEPQFCIQAILSLLNKGSEVGELARMAIQTSLRIQSVASKQKGECSQLTKRGKQVVC